MALISVTPRPREVAARTPRRHYERDEKANAGRPPPSLSSLLPTSHITHFPPVGESGAGVFMENWGRGGG
ncbi:hypothetical protein E2C01_091960 [Portunus trituberculatus]|uniref:Uncharacterized protein n=1 Tax=Portunus trituberculatus TaxID=210409 RepID=A0A5B7JQ36_PORTR|nr:hypothetical protein [Portunus trituberculatus]